MEGGPPRTALWLVTGLLYVIAATAVVCCLLSSGGALGLHSSRPTAKLAALGLPSGIRRKRRGDAAFHLRAGLSVMAFKVTARRTGGRVWLQVAKQVKSSQVKNYSSGNMEQAPSRGHEASP